MEKFAEPLRQLSLISPADMHSLTEADLKTELGMNLGEYRAFLRKAADLPNVESWSQLTVAKRDRMTCIHILLEHLC